MRSLTLIIAASLLAIWHPRFCHGLDSPSRPDSSPQVSFINDVIPIFTKLGCNAGVCHAKAGGGQNGFELSLLGFEPQEDYESIVKGGRGRRVSPGLPDQSLLLLKASGRAPHGGGARLSVDSPEYDRIRRWIQQGMPLKLSGEPKLEKIEVEPSNGRIERNHSEQLKAIAWYSDGSSRDVTDMALYESNTPSMVSVSESGLVKTKNIPGRLAVMVRYQGKVAVFTAAVPLGPRLESTPSPNNFIDEFVFQNLSEIGIAPSQVCDDSTFLRRVTLDVTGRLPTEEQTIAFLKDNDPEKRNRLIDRLLRSPGYADYFASKWTPLLKNRRDEASDITANFAFHAWVRDSLLANVPYDQFVRELLAATGTIVASPPVAWYKRVKDPKEQLEDIAQLFLGVRMQCAQCHHHPFEKWSQDDYYSFAAFFSRIGRKPTGVQGEDMIFHKRGLATATNVRTGKALAPMALGDSVGKIRPDEDPRLKLADWMGSPENPYFAKALVNRYWKHFFKVGLIEPEDDIRDTNPPTNPALLAALEKHFVRSGYDLKSLVRVIVSSKTYQLSSKPQGENIKDRQNYSRFYPRRLQAEVLLDAIDDLTGTRTTFANLPKGTRAVALPDNSYNKQSAFLRAFGRPENLSVCECERERSSSLGQRLHLINSREIKRKLSTPAGRATKLAASKIPLEQKIQSLYRVAFSRLPDSDELKIAVEYLQQTIKNPQGQSLATAKSIQMNMQDLVWALMNTKEFLFNH